MIRVTLVNNEALIQSFKSRPNCSVRIKYDIKENTFCIETVHFTPLDKLAERNLFRKFTFKGVDYGLYAFAVNLSKETFDKINFICEESRLTKTIEVCQKSNNIK